MKQKSSEIILVVILSILVILSNLFVNEENSYYSYIRIVGYILFIIYMGIRFWKKDPIKIFQSKLDIGILFLVISTGIPLICNTYVSLSGTILVILQYIYMYMMYLLIREIAKQKQNFPKRVVNLLIILAVVTILIGIDGLTSHYFTGILNRIGKGDFINGDNRLISVFGYPNVLAAYLASLLFLNINQFLKQPKQAIKIAYKTVTLILMIGIILTYSKAIWLLLPIILLFYVWLVKEKRKKVEILQNIAISFILTILFLLIFEKLLNTQNYLLMWILFALIVSVNYLIYLVIEKLELKKRKITPKRMLPFLLVIILGVILYPIIGLQIYEEYEVFTSKKESSYEAKIINHIQGNTEYIFEFDIEAKAPRDIENTYTINLIERDEKNQEINQTAIQFGTFQGKKQIKLQTQETSKEVKVEFKSEYPYKEKKLTIKNLKMNQKEIPLKYKYFPTKLAEKVQNISIQYKTVKERLEMIQNAVTLTKEHPLAGIGGNGWQYRYQEVQNYPYIAKSLHSYPAKVMLEFGLGGIIAYLIIGILIVKILRNAIKNQNLDRMSVLFAFLVIGIHSIIDVDMEYIHILAYTFGLMGILVSQDKNTNKIGNFSKIANGILVIIAILSIYLTIDTSSYQKYGEIVDLLRQRNGLANNSQEYKETNNKIAKQYEKILAYERYNQLEIYGNIILYKLNANDEDSLAIIENYYDKIATYEKKNVKNKDKIMSKVRIVHQVLIELDKQNNVKYNEITQKFMELLLKECEKIKNLIGQEENSYKSELDKIQKEAGKIKNSYLLGVKIINDSQIQIDEQKLENIEVENSKEILLYHTHGTESYKAEQEYEMYDFYKSLDENYNVMKIGDSLTELLNEKGIKTIHNREYHNYPVKTGTYARSRETVTKILEGNVNINKIIDIHRDSYSTTEHEANTIRINGEEVAPLRFVIGVNQEDKDWMYDLKWAIEMQKVADQRYPGLILPMLIREEEYNQDIAKYAVLVEVGENSNTMQQVLNSIKYFSELVR